MSRWNRRKTGSFSAAKNKISDAVRVMDHVVDLVRSDLPVTDQLIRYLVDAEVCAPQSQESQFRPGFICLTAKGQAVYSKTAGQKVYVDAIAENELTFAIGPAGTGKTYLAVAAAVQAFRNQDISRIILTRPAVEAGEKLGFLPGDLQMKVDPYMRPLHDALFELMGADVYQRQFERGLIEISPLAYMRGRTLDNAFIILDEAQNTTSEQMKMFLTRIGFGSKAVVTGDITQIDLPREKRSGLKDVRRILQHIEGIGFIELGRHDIVRSPLVQRIIKAYETYEPKGAKR